MLNKVILQEGSPVTMKQAVMKLLPITGSVEVQRDTPHREHKTHTHSTNETLLIISGEITFTVDDNSIVCTSGDRILLTAETIHSSIAGKMGVYTSLHLSLKIKKMSYEDKQQQIKKIIKY